MNCDYHQKDEQGSHCLLAEKWSGLPIVSVTDDACKVCLSLKGAPNINRVTVSIACVQGKKDSNEKFEELVARGRSYISDPGVVERVQRYVSSTDNWIRAGSPVRDDQEVDTVLKICRSNECGQFVANSDGETGHCRVCGCELNRLGGLVNKIRRSTEHCPLGKW